MTCLYLSAVLRTAMVWGASMEWWAYRKLCRRTICSAAGFEACPRRSLRVYHLWPLPPLVSLVPEGLDRVKIRSFPGRVNPESDANGRANQQTQHRPVRREDWRDFQKVGGHVAADDAQHHADHPAHFAEHHRLHHELSHDIPFPGPDGAADADFARPLRHRHQHDVHDAYARGQQRNRADYRDADADRAGESLELLDQGIVGEDFKIVLLAGRHLPEGAQDAARLLDGVLVARGVARLHEDRKTPPGPAVAVQSGGDRDHHEAVLLAAQRRVERRQHARHRVIDAVEFDAITDRGTKWEERFRQPGAEH